MFSYILIGVIVVLVIGALMFGLSKLFQLFNEEIQRLEREQHEYYENLRKTKIKQACSLFRIMFCRYREADIPKKKAMIMAMRDTLYVAVDEGEDDDDNGITHLDKTQLFEYLRNDVPELLEDYDADDFKIKITDDWDTRDLSIDDYL